jgi:hypothetical protein
MAASDTNSMNDHMPWSPISATASIFPALVAPVRDDVGTALLVELGSLRPFGLDLEAPEPEARA